MSDDINPRVDEDGVAWCSEHCTLRFIGPANGTPLWCDDTGMRERVCPVAARRNAALLRDCRNALMRYRSEVPVGHQPAMFAHAVDDLLERIGE